MKIKKNDKVILLTGKDRGKQGVVLRTFPAIEKVIVEGVNIQKRHVKRNKNTKQGLGIVEISAPVHVSNVQLLDPKTGKPTRIGVQKNAKTGKNERVAKKSGTVLA